MRTKRVRLFCPLADQTTEGEVADRISHFSISGNRRAVQGFRSARVGYPAPTPDWLPYTFSELYRLLSTLSARMTGNRETDDKKFVGAPC